MKRFPSFLCFLMAAAISASLTGCGGSPGAGSSAQGQSADPPAQSAQPEAGTPAADPSGAPDHNVPGEGPAGAVPEGEPSTLYGGSEQGQNVPNSPEDKPAHVGESGESSYDFSQPAPESPAVDNTYFEDAAFVGDSRTDGFLLGVDLHIEDLRGESQQRTEDGAHGAEDSDALENQFKIHIHALLSRSSCRRSP